ncbi:MAG TPA: hypothetical protein PLY23_06095, partial [Alphaproteobacteria bacterium]|nr:hypothetical protein [Alphaproteobacteria bacterium]
EDALKACTLYYGQSAQISGFDVDHRRYLNSLLPSNAYGRITVQEGFLTKFEEALAGYNLYYSAPVQSLKSSDKIALRKMLSSTDTQFPAGWLKAFQDRLDALKQSAAK